MKIIGTKTAAWIKILLFGLLIALAGMGCRDASKDDADKDKDPTGDTGKPSNSTDSGGTTIIGENDYLGTAANTETGTDSDSMSPTSADDDVKTPPSNDTGEQVEPDVYPDTDEDYVDEDWDDEYDEDYDAGGEDWEESDYESEYYDEDDEDWEESDYDDDDEDWEDNWYEDTEMTDTDPEKVQDCEKQAHGYEGEYCEIYYDCDDGWSGMGCEGWEDEAWCYCNNGDMGYEFEITGMSAEDACAAFIETCVADEEPTPVGEEECENRHQSADDDSCEVEYRCQQTVAVGEDVTAEINDWKYTYCRENDGVWECNCSGGTTYMQLSMTTDAEPLTLCQDTMKMCDDPSGMITGDSITCEVDSQSARPTRCDADIRCEQQAEYNGAPMDVAGFTYTRCEREDEDATDWECQCGGGPERVTFALPGDSSWDTCTAAAEQCINVVYETGEIGGGGDNYYYEDDWDSDW